MNGIPLLDLVKQFGFPAAVAGWLLYWLPQMQTTLVLVVDKLDRLIQLAERAP